MIAGIIYLVVAVIELLLAARFILLFIGANPASPFVAWVYTWSQPFAAPFAGIFGQHITVAGPGVVTTGIFDWTTLIALAVFAIIGGILAKLVSRI